MEYEICYSPLVHWNALADGYTKYIFHACDGSEQLFELDRDSHELHDLTVDLACGSQLRIWRGRMVERI